jgi:hypothetical protein
MADGNHDHAIDFIATLNEELAEIRLLRERRLHAVIPAPAEAPAQVTGPEEAAHNIVEKALGMNLAGLAFSGGGIRSATFNLGVLQGLARFKCLRLFDYLSTVSGGGYIGGWLETWIQRAGAQLHEQKITDKQGIDIVEEELHPDRTERVKSWHQASDEPYPSHNEPTPIGFLRKYSNYLTPRLGALGADAWTLVSIYLRNLILNQLILILFLFSLLLLPYLGVKTEVFLHSAWPKMPQFIPPFLAMLLLSVAMVLCAWQMCGLTDQKRTIQPFSKGALRVSLALSVLAAWILTSWLWPQSATILDAHLLAAWLNVKIVLALVFAIPFLLASLVFLAREAGILQRHPIYLLSWQLASLLAGSTAAGLTIFVVRQLFLPIQNWGDHGGCWHLMSLGIPLMLLVLLLASALEIGLLGRDFWDPYREWCGRFGGMLLLLTMLWTAGFSLAFYAPLALIAMHNWIHEAGILWIISTLGGIFGAKSEKTGAPDGSSFKAKLLSCTPYLFIVGLFSGLALCLELILARIQMARFPDRHYLEAWNLFLAKSPHVEKTFNLLLNLTGSASPHSLAVQGTTSYFTPDKSALPPYLPGHFQLLHATLDGPLLLIALTVALGLCLLLSWRIDLNEFSMNLLYRNRLVRCYLGATNTKRAKNTFTGLDCRDDMLFSQLVSVNALPESPFVYSGPLPIINTTLNLVNSEDLAWQERKAESFQITPLRCGYDLWLRDSQSRQTEQRYAYRPTRRYAFSGGFYIGTAMSISGAAASPNMGYHSSPALALLLTFFNVRLGFWSGNPRMDASWTKAAPRVGLFRLLAELTGNTNDQEDFVYLSDGGHFENLGIYELVKRRCKFIVAVDAGADPDYTFEDLGNAIRKCREDIGVEIVINTDQLKPVNADKNQTPMHFAMGRILYQSADETLENGTLIYLKASVTGQDEPTDVLNYQSAHADFPHQSTADQWFSESQFESYRRLGLHVVDKLFSGPEDKYPEPASLHSEADALRLLNGLRQRWNTVFHLDAPAS